MQGSQVKICGITKLDQALAIADLGVGALGFIFHPPSPRYIAPIEAKKIIELLPPFTAKIGVFVDMPIIDIISIYKEISLDWLQLHGSESLSYTQKLSEQNIKWYKAFRISHRADFTAIESFQSPWILLDSKMESVYGGSGQIFDWSLVPPDFSRKRLILSGGLKADNILEALNRVKPSAIDLSSGVESAPGIKDIAKVKSILAKINLV